MADVDLLCHSRKTANRIRSRTTTTVMPAQSSEVKRVSIFSIMMFSLQHYRLIQSIYANRYLV